MVGAGHRDAGNRPSGGVSNRLRVKRRSHLVYVRSKNEERSGPRSGPGQGIVAIEIFQHLSPYAHFLSDGLDGRLILGRKLGSPSQKQMPQMRSGRRRRQKRHAPALGNVMDRREHGRPTEAVPEEKVRPAERHHAPTSKGLRRRQDIGNVGREVGVAEVPTALTRPGKVEAEDAKAPGRECRHDACSASQIFRGSERVREKKCPSKGRPLLRKIYARGEFGAGPAEKPHLADVGLALHLRQSSVW